jgi:hypothetical protein
MLFVSLLSDENHEGLHFPKEQVFEKVPGRKTFPMTILFRNLGLDEEN